MSGEVREIRLKRMRMRAAHRGTKEMDLILGGFAEARLESLTPEQLDLFDALMEENDQDLYLWVSGQAEPPELLLPLVETIARHAGAR